MTAHPRRTGVYHGLGAGIGAWLVHLFIWRMIWRIGMTIWRIPTFGPIIVVLLVAGGIALAVLRRGRWPRRRRGGVFGYGSGSGPRDW